LFATVKLLYYSKAAYSALPPKRIGFVIEDCKMTVTCEYCRSANEVPRANCATCGAPLGEAAAIDPHQCPYCKRRLLALGSPNCNYCGRRLPPDFIKANTSDLNRVKELSGRDNAVEISHIVDFLETANRKDKTTTNSIISDLTDLLS
jgi:DNA-directed RNA polymerase subunit RPC12/RpoP